jgi:hypothetical protein
MPSEPGPALDTFTFRAGARRRRVKSMKRVTVLLIAMLCLPAAAFAQRGSADDAAVRRTIADHYFKAHATGNGEALKGTFIDEGRMMWVQDGQLRTRASADYIAGFPGKPAADEAQRKRRVVMTDVTGDIAMAKVELDYPDGIFIDYFTLARLSGEWKIIHKAFQRPPKAK